jgi:hypothetical protein
MFAYGCNTDEPAEVGTNNTSTNVGTGNNATTPGNNVTTPGNNITTVNNITTGNNATTPAPTPLPTTFALTNGGGTAESAEHKITLTVGSPQPYGQAADGNNKLLIGPIVPVAAPQQ